MIRKIKIKSLKSIDNLILDCKNMNLIVGPNSSGKSTILQSLLLLKQNIKKEYGLNGPNVSLGEYRESKNFNTKSNEIYVEIKSDDNTKLALSIQEDINNDVDKVSIFGEKKMINNLLFISSQRIGYRDVYNKSVTNFSEFDFYGEYIIDILKRNAKVRIEEKLVKSDIDHTLIGNVNYWLKYILNTEIRVEDIKGTDVIKAEYDVNNTRFVRPKNVGAGTSYLISILISCLTSRINSLILIESPEIHLHPSAQSKLCQFLYFISTCDRQLFVETHSDHFFNAIRVGIVTNEIDDDKTQINYVELDDNNCSDVKSIIINKQGVIINNQENLFNQFDYDLNKILGI